MNINQSKLIETFAKALNVSSEIITDELSYQSIPEWDSVSHMVLISFLEEAFEVSIDTDDVIDLSSVAKAREILKKLNISF